MKRADRIKKYLYDFVGTKTHTNTELERNNEVYYRSYFKSIDYLKENPENYGFYEIKNDYHGRKVTWALLKGQGKKTIVLIHHTDTVDTEDFGEFKEYAHNPEKITKLYAAGKISVNEAVQEDIDSGDWLFGRGVCDMKGGGAIQQTLFEEYCQEEDFKGNVLLMGLPDEENLSAGMLSGIKLLNELKDKHDLDYVLMLNSEPHERRDPNKPVFADGSIGKIMPIVLVKGKLAHSGVVYRGLNPINILAEIVRRTEINPNFIEKVGNTATPPPTWLNFKDRKYIYDVSLPMSVGGYISILTLEKSPKEIIEKLKEIAIESFDLVLEDYENSLKEYKKFQNLDYDFEFKTNVKLYEEIYAEVIKNPKDREVLEDLKFHLVSQINQGSLDLREACFQLMERTLDLYDYNDPIVVIGIAPPFYPATNNMYLEDKKGIDDLIEVLRVFSQEELNQDFEIQNFFTGISDLSYAMFAEEKETVEYVEHNMLLWGDYYSIPFEEIRKVSMPVLNIGPWGKDLHKGVERVYKKDLYEDIPKYVDFVIRESLK